MKGKAFIGTSGWNYKHWRGTIYEPGFPQRLWLGRIAQQFDTVEVNTSFYSVPKRESVEAWERATPPSFVFALKLWRGITHYRKLRNAAELTERFLQSAEALTEDRRAPLLIQLPPNQGVDADKLKAYIEQFRSLAPGRWRLALEFRNNAWLQPAIYHLLDRLGVALCLHDMDGKGATDEANDAPLVYVRRHGSGGQRYAGSYSPEQIALDAARILQWNESGKDVYVYYNNDIGGHAFYNATALRESLRSILEGRS
ncbi:MAG: DUF72 domain-containing protein [Bryobacteraceae bacterium]